MQSVLQNSIMFHRKNGLAIAIVELQPLQVCIQLDSRCLSILFDWIVVKGLILHRAVNWMGKFRFLRILLFHCQWIYLNCSLRLSVSAAGVLVLLFSSQSFKKRSINTNLSPSESMQNYKWVRKSIEILHVWHWYNICKQKSCSKKVTHCL